MENSLISLINFEYMHVLVGSQVYYGKLIHKVRKRKSGSQLCYTTDRIRALINIDYRTFLMRIDWSLREKSLDLILRSRFFLARTLLLRVLGVMSLLRFLSASPYHSSASSSAKSWAPCPDPRKTPSPFTLSPAASGYDSPESVFP